MASSGTRRMRIVAVAAASLAAALGVGAWATVADGSEAGYRGLAAAARQAEPARSDNPVPAGPTTTAPATTASVALPVPEPAPADEYAPTPEVVLGTLALPSLGVSEPMGEGVTLTAVDRGHWPGTAMPGQVGNVVVAGHRTTNSRPFYDLDLLQVGDPLVFTMPDGATWTYEHTGTEIVGSDALHIVDQTPAQTATLFACHPKGSARQRIVAHFRLVGT